MRIALVVLLSLSSLFAVDAHAATDGETHGGPVFAGKLETGAAVFAVQAPDGTWGIEVRSPASASLLQRQPLQVTLYGEQGAATNLAAGYRAVAKTAGGLTGKGTLSTKAGASFHVEDRWTIAGPVLELARTVRVSGSAPGGFVSAFILATRKKFAWSDVRYFIPGAIYGAPEHMATWAPGGTANYEAGRVELREDAMAAPLFGLYFGDGSSIALLNRRPRGDTTAADSSEPEKVQTGSRFLFGAMGGQSLPQGGIEFGYWFPGTEGRYPRVTAPAALRIPRRRMGDLYQVRQPLLRYHPVRDGLEQRYDLGLRFGREETYHEFYKRAWRWSWAVLKPAVQYHDIEVVRRSLIDMLAKETETHNGRSGLPNAISPKPYRRDRKAVMGFTGKNLEAAVFMLMEAERDRTQRGAELRRVGLAIVDSFLPLKVAPPVGEGFNLDTGETVLSIPRDNMVYLRSFSDDMKILLRGYKFERQHGREHPEWLQWCARFGDWLLTQQQPGGGFPRGWAPGTGEAKDAAPQSSYNAVPLLVLLTELTGLPKYREAALRAAGFVWTAEHAMDHFAGGTIDNPNIIDKEAATVSTEAYLALYESTKARKWLERAQASADNAETYVFIWNVPMPEDAQDAALHWKKGVPSVGLNGVNSSGPGGCDQYMAFDADEYAKLYKYTGDPHYLDVARILLHNTKSMLAIPGRTYDLPGPGWQTENFAVAVPRRGVGANRIWLPWVSTSHLNGILFTEEFDPDLFGKLAARPAAQ